MIILDLSLIHIYKISRMTGSFNLITESAYIDDPFVLDNLGELGFMPLSEDVYKRQM